MVFDFQLFFLKLFNRYEFLKFSLRYQRLKFLHFASKYLHKQVHVSAKYMADSRTWYEVSPLGILLLVLFHQKYVSPFSARVRRRGMMKARGLLCHAIQYQTTTVKQGSCLAIYPLLRPSFRSLSSSFQNQYLEDISVSFHYYILYGS